MAKRVTRTRIEADDRLRLERIADDLRAKLGSALDSETASEALGTRVAWVDASGLLDPGEYAWRPSWRALTIARCDTQENQRFALAHALALPALYSTWEGCARPLRFPEDPALVLAIQDAFAARLLGGEAVA